VKLRSNLRQLLDHTLSRNACEAGMKALFALSLSLGLIAACAARAESLRCAAGIVAEGDSRLSLVYKCGEPTLQQSFCATVYYSTTGYPVPDYLAPLVAPCVLVEEWLYDRGPGNMMATVHIRSGRVESITYGRSPP
jgi:hypothetical protein